MPLTYLRHLHPARHLFVEKLLFSLPFADLGGRCRKFGSRRKRVSRDLTVRRWSLLLYSCTLLVLSRSDMAMVVGPVSRREGETNAHPRDDTLAGAETWRINGPEVEKAKCEMQKMVTVIIGQGVTCSL